MTEVQTNQIDKETIEKAFTYEEYRALIDDLLEQDMTTGENHSEAMLHYTKMNVHRMKRLDSRTKLSEGLVNKLQNLERDMIWLVLTEAWCGDAAQIVPVIEKIAKESEHITTAYILRDQNLGIMDQFLTNGKSRSIPKLICLDKNTLKVLGSWGPRPIVTQEFYKELKDDPEISGETAAENLHKWYAKDRTESTQTELLKKIENWQNA